MENFFYFINSLEFSKIFIKSIYYVYVPYLL